MGRNDGVSNGRIRGADRVRSGVACFCISVILNYNTMKVYSFCKLLSDIEEAVGAAFGRDVSEHF
jgi:hypothetical protein